MVAPPSDVIVPPIVADVAEIPVTPAVTNTGTVARVPEVVSDDFLQPVVKTRARPITNEPKIFDTDKKFAFITQSICVYKFLVLIGFIRITQI